MSDTNQIIKALHDKADSQLSSDLSNLYDHITNFVTSHGAWFGAEVEADGKKYQVNMMTRWLVYSIIKPAVADKCREKAVNNFMDRVAKLGDEIDEIRAIAEQSHQQ
jgi:predicted P-loop ATPase